MRAPTVADWPPRWLTPVPDDAIAAGDGPDVCDFIEATCRVTMDSIAAPYGTPLVLRHFQTRLVERLFARDPATGLKRHRVALVGVARKNGKSALLAAIALFELFYGQRGGQVYVVAGTRDQARIIFETAKQMVRMEPELAEIAEIKRDAIYARDTHSSFQVMSSDAASLEGLNPTFVAFDEVHVQPDRSLWDVFSLAQGARRDAQLVGITTAGVRTDRTGHDSLCYSLYSYGIRVALGELDDPSFFMGWWEPEAPSADHRLPSTWREGNPGFGDIVGEADFHAQVLKTPEAEFRTKRCNQWVSTATTWLPYGAWAQCGDGVAIADGADVVLGFDGSYSGDCTAIVAATVGESPPRIAPVRIWELTGEGATIPILEVEEEIRLACKRWTVLEIAADPYRWSRSLEVLAEDELPVEPFPQSPSRMVPATTRFYEAVVNHEICHDRDPVLARHLDNAAIKVDARGSRLTKGTFKRKIDAAVAAVMALERAAWWTANREDADPEVYWL